MSKTLPVLAKADDAFGPANPEGWKLEDLCVQLIAELNDKNHKYIKEIRHGVRELIQNNSDTINKLAGIIALQHDNACLLSRINREPTRHTSKNAIYPDSVDEEINF